MPERSYQTDIDLERVVKRVGYYIHAVSPLVLVVALGVAAITGTLGVFFGSPELAYIDIGACGIAMVALAVTLDPQLVGVVAGKQDSCDTVAPESASRAPDSLASAGHDESRSSMAA